jgi:two-component system chemotaxis sensor kinase CheA
MNLIFRPFHTLKGGAGFLQLESIGKVTHTTENLLQIFRADPAKWRHEFIDILMKSSDLLRNMLDQVETEFHDSGFDDEMADLISILEKRFQELSSQSKEKGEIQGDYLPVISGPPTKPLEAVLKQTASFLTSLVESNWKVLESEKNYKETIELIEELVRHYHQIVDRDPVASNELFYLPGSEKADSNRSAGESTGLESTKKEPVDEITDKLKGFATSTLEHLENIEGIMLVLDKIPGDVDTNEYLQSALRSFHTIKGNAGFLNQNLIESVSHSAENTITGIQDGKINLDENSIALVFQIVDTLRSAVSSLSEENPINRDALSEIEKKLALMSSEKDPSLLGNILVKMGKVKSDDVKEAIKHQKAPLGDLLIKMGKVSKNDIDEALTQQQSAKKQTVAAALMGQSSVAKMQDIRVSLEKLDLLFDLVGELIISESMIARHPALAAVESDSIKNISGQLHRNMRNG